MPRRGESTHPPFAPFAGGGETGAAMRCKDWSNTALGAPDTWSPVLRSMVALVLASKQPMFVAWGDDLCFLYNDAYVPLLRDRGAAVLGVPFAEAWPELWEQFGPIAEATLAGEAQKFENLALPMAHNELRYFTFSYTPLQDHTGTVAGFFCAATDTTNHVLTERELAAENQRLGQLFDRAPGFMCVLRGPDHLFELVNQSYLQLVGHRDLVGKPVREALPEVVDQGFVGLLDGVYTTGEPFVGRQLRADLQRRPGADVETCFIDVVYTPIRDAAGAVMGIFVQGSDVTDTHRAQEALRAVNADLERRIDERSHELGQTWRVSPDLLAVLTREGFFERTNPAWQTCLGWTAEELGRVPFVEFLHPGDRARTEAAFETMMQGDPVLRFENRYRTKDGAFRWITWVAVPSAGKFYCTGRDITEEKRQAAELTARTAERDRLWTLSEDMLARADYAGNLKAVSPSWTRVLGYTETELLTNPYADIIHPENAEEVVAALLRMAETGQPTRFDNRILAANGTWKPVSWTVAPEADGVHFIAVGRDMTAEKAREKELFKAQDQLRQAQKMEAVGQLTGGIAHDFNNLLQGITGSLYVVQKRIGEGRTKDLERFIDGAVTSAKRAASLTHRLLAFSRRQPLDPKPVQANPLVASVEDLLRRTLGERIALDLRLADGLWLTRCDPNQLESALLNLVINARDAMPDGGRLTVATSNAQLPGEPMRDVVAGPYVCIAVTDTGTGMPPEVVARAFDPFFTTKPLGQGSGLGLSMIYGFARQSEGHCTIQSEPGRGTTVSLYLPRHRDEALEEDSRPTAATVPPAEHDEVVVVVEDEAVVRELIVEVLGDLGYRTLEAHDGPSGVALLQSLPHVDLLITDIGLPGLNGRQVADAARALRPDLKVLFMTGYAENAAAAGGFLQPGMSLLTKPFAMDALATLVRSMLEDT